MGVQLLRLYYTTSENIETNSPQLAFYLGFKYIVVKAASFVYTPHGMRRDLDVYPVIAMDQVMLIAEADFICLPPSQNITRVMLLEHIWFPSSRAPKAL